jgi:phosphatidylinositol-3-phosphatase
MNRSSAAWTLGLAALLFACGGSPNEATGGGGGSGGDDGGSSGHDGPSSDSASGRDGTIGPDGGDSGGGDAAEGGSGTCTSACPAGYACGTANGKSVCRAKSGIPLFSHIFVILMENTSLSTLNAAVSAGDAPNLKALGGANATASAYHGVAHPSLPNYIALTSGSTHGVGCDCQPVTGQGSCNIAVCNLLLGDCSCNQSATNLADQIESAKETWMAYGEGMGSPCNTSDDGATSYAVRHIPFLYYDDIQTDSSRCTSHIVDFSGFSPASAPTFSFIAPNLTDDMHNPDPTTSVNIPDGDKWIGPQVAAIMATSNYKDGGLVVVVWDEDDGSGGITGTDDPVPIYLMSPYAKNGGFVSAVEADHYSLLATIEDGLNLPRLGEAGMTRPMKADTLSDFFPAK